jgi:hypothetical protein
MGVTRRSGGVGAPGGPPRLVGPEFQSLPGAVPTSGVHHDLEAGIDASTTQASLSVPLLV